MDTITTRTVGTGFAEIGESVLTETTQTAIVFQTADARRRYTWLDYSV